MSTTNWVSQFSELPTRCPDGRTFWFPGLCESGSCESARPGSSRKIVGKGGLEDWENNGVPLSQFPCACQLGYVPPVGHGSERPLNGPLFEKSPPAPSDAT